jgi:hypothetical protein
LSSGIEVTVWPVSGEIDSLGTPVGMLQGRGLVARLTNSPARQGFRAIVRETMPGVTVIQEPEGRGVMTAGVDRISIHGPGDDGSYVIEFRTADGEFLALAMPASEARISRYFQARMPNGLVLPNADSPDEDVR